LLPPFPGKPELSKEILPEEAPEKGIFEKGRQWFFPVSDHLGSAYVHYRRLGGLGHFHEGCPNPARFQG
jgi:hypothetical protein